MILYRDNSWLAVNKPTGMSTHAPRAGELGVVEWLELHLDLKTHVVSRLDRGTSGVLLLAVDAAASARAESIHAEGGATKIYEFLTTVDSHAAGLGDTWQNDEPLDGKAASTRFECLGVFAPGANMGTDHSLFRYRATLSRGRHHQIRRHAAAGGLPLLGDAEHGGAPWPRLCLHCREVRWPEIAAPVQAPLPVSFDSLAVAATDLDLALALCRDRRGDWLEPITDTYRLVARDEIDTLPVAVDIYGDWFNAIWYGEDDEPEDIRQALQPLCARITAKFGCRGGVIRSHRRNPHQRSLVAGVTIVGEPSPDTFFVQEHGLSYAVNLTRTQHTGLFLDQRDSRRRIALLAEGARVANLFAFTCSFSVAAVAHAAEVAFSVDTAKACLETGKQNFAINDLTAAGRGKFIQEDARKWLCRQLRRRANSHDDRALDLVVCDPPVFASSRDGGKFSVQDEWPFLAKAVAGLLARDGTAIFANNHRAGDRARYRRELELEFARVTPLMPPLDFWAPSGKAPQVHTFLCKHPRNDK